MSSPSAGSLTAPSAMTHTLISFMPSQKFQKPSTAHYLIPSHVLEPVSNAPHCAVSFYGPGASLLGRQLHQPPGSVSSVRTQTHSRSRSCSALKITPWCQHSHTGLVCEGIFRWLNNLQGRADLQCHPWVNTGCCTWLLLAKT